MTRVCHHLLRAVSVVTLLTVASAVLAAGPAGTDEQAVGMVKVLAPDYRPWFSPLLEPPPGGAETLLFALQAACGLGVIGYYLIVKRRQLRAGKKDGSRAA
jgi:cobalt/nickel transport protein